MNKGKVINTKGKAFFISIILILVYLLLLRLFAFTFYSLNVITYQNYYIWSAVVHGLLALVLIAITKKLGLMNLFKEKGKGILYTLCTAGFIIVFLTYALVEDLEFIYSEGEVTLLPLAYQLGFIVDMLIGAGLCEELLFRGLIQNLFIREVEKFDRKQVLKVMFLTSFLFGLAHMNNVFSGASVEGAFYQMLGAMAVGFYFSAIYFRGNNLYAMILLHFYNDFSILMSSGIFGQGMDIFETIDSYDSTKLIGVVLYTVVTLIILRKKKMDEIIEYRNGLIEQEKNKELEEKKKLEEENMEENALKEEVKRIVEENYKEE